MREEHDIGFVSGMVPFFIHESARGINILQERYICEVGMERREASYATYNTLNKQQHTFNHDHDSSKQLKCADIR